MTFPSPLLYSKPNFHKQSDRPCSSCSCYLFVDFTNLPTPYAGIVAATLARKSNSAQPCPVSRVSCSVSDSTRAPLLPATPGDHSNMVSASDVSSIHDWLTDVKHKAREAGYTAGQFTLYNIDDCHDDSNFRPTTQLAIEQLKGRFLLRLATAFGNGGAWNSPTVAMLREADQGKTASIRVLRKRSNKDRIKDLDLSELAQKIAQRLQSIRYLATETTRCSTKLCTTQYANCT